MKQPLISFIVPIYRVEDYLRQCLNSLISQTIRNTEIILIDDGSPDNSGKIADQFAEPDSRVKVIHKKNAGLGMARNSGLEIATGKYVCFVDSDDWLELSGLEALVERAEMYGVDIVVSGFYDWDPGTQCKVYVPTPMPEGIYAHNEIIDGFWLPMIESAHRKYWCTAWRGIYRRDFIENNNLRFPSEKEQLVEDLPFNLIAYYKAKSMYLLDKAYYHYRFNEKSLTNTYNASTVERYAKMRSYMVSFAREAGMEASLLKRLKARDYRLILFSISGILSTGLDVGLMKRFKLAKELVCKDELRYIFRGLKISRLKEPRLAKTYIAFIKYKLPILLILLSYVRRHRC
jgi:glycosyltransferase involved in cell wall biosynthesis